MERADGRKNHHLHTRKHFDANFLRASVSDARFPCHISALVAINLSPLGLSTAPGGLLLASVLGDALLLQKVGDMKLAMPEDPISEIKTLKP